MWLLHGLCLPARPQVSQGPFTGGSLRQSHTSPRAASCLGQTMTCRDLVPAGCSCCQGFDFLPAEEILATRDLLLVSPSQERHTQMWSLGPTEFSNPFMC